MAAWRRRQAGCDNPALVPGKHPIRSPSEPSPKLKGQVLVVSKVAGDTGQGCVVGYVDALANPEPNALARKVADRLQRKELRLRTRIKPRIHGIRGPTAAEPTHVFPD
jgi:hypothetical protein